MADWECRIANLVDPTDDSVTGLGSVITADVLVGDQAQELQFTEQLNAAGSCQFTLPIDTPDPDVYALEQREVHIYRDDVLQWGGYLTQAEVTYPFVRFGAMGWFERLRRRVIRTDFSYQRAEQVDIPWELLQYTQARAYGNLGITRYGNPSSGKLRSVIYCGHEGTLVSEAIEELSEQDDGYDFVVTPDKEFRVWTPKAANPTAAVIDAGAQADSAAGFDPDASATISMLHVMGPRQTCSEDETIELQNAAALERYGLLEDVLQVQRNDEDMRRAIGREELRSRLAERFQPVFTVEPELTDMAWRTLAIGDIITAKSAIGWATFESQVRITGITYDIHPGAQRETLTVETDAA